MISILVDIFYPPNFSHFDRTGVFQQPLPITLTEGFERYGLLTSVTVVSRRFWAEML
jgi:hypothetical protein